MIQHKCKNPHSIKIGAYTICQPEGGKAFIWLDEEEGGTFSEKELEKAIKGFYDKNF